MSSQAPGTTVTLTYQELSQQVLDSQRRVFVEVVAVEETLQQIPAHLEGVIRGKGREDGGSTLSIVNMNLSDWFSA
jgi:hypothetical protein